MKSVYTVYRKREFGYSLISVLVTLAILWMLLPFTVYFLQSLTFSSYYEEMSVQQFFHFMQADLFMANDYIVEPYRLTLIVDDDIVTFAQFGTNVRRQVGGTGQDIYLRDIQTMTFEETRFGIRIYIITLAGGVYEKTLRFDL